MNKIWCLFSVANMYDQPNNNLVCWFEKKPSIEKLAQTLGATLQGDDTILSIVNISQGKKSRLFGADYRLEEVGELKILKED